MLLNAQFPAPVLTGLIYMNLHLISRLPPQPELLKLELSLPRPEDGQTVPEGTIQKDPQISWSSTSSSPRALYHSTPSTHRVSSEDYGTMSASLQVAQSLKLLWSLG